MLFMSIRMAKNEWYLTKSMIVLLFKYGPEAKNGYTVEKYIKKYTWIFLDFHLKKWRWDVILKFSKSILRMYKEVVKRNWENWEYLYSRPPSIHQV